MTEEIEFTLKIKKIRRGTEDPKWEIRQVADHIFFGPGDVFSVEVMDQSIHPASVEQQIKNSVYKRAIEELYNPNNWKKNKFSDFTVHYSRHQKDPRIEIRSFSKLCTLNIKPISAEDMQITCMCLGNGIEVNCKIDNLSDEIFRIMKEHECVPWPG